MREQQQQHELQVLHQRQQLVEYNAQQKQALLQQQQLHERSAHEQRAQAALQHSQLQQLYNDRSALECLLKESRDVVKVTQGQAL